MIQGVSEGSHSDMGGDEGVAFNTSGTERYDLENQSVPRSKHSVPWL